MSSTKTSPRTPKSFREQSIFKQHLTVCRNIHLMLGLVCWNSLQTLIDPLSMKKNNLRPELLGKPGQDTAVSSPRAAAAFWEAALGCACWPEGH